jgi:branched-chain amino acid transport system ATP-binding protein|tara:strand:- start:1729 stop:2433 length:705 start_codon:yes stop_codon:yes gene_type:complete
MMLSVQSIEAAYGDSQVLFGMTLEVSAGEFVTLLGRNGMGKTTTVKSIMGILSVIAGNIKFEEKTISNLPSFRVAKYGIGLVPEGRQIFPNLTVRENLIATAIPATNKGDGWSLERVIDLFPILRDRLGSMGNQLSGGEQQMLAIGRALMTNPRLLILDEATEGLAPMIRHEIWTCLQRLKQESLALLVIDKNVDILSQIADRHYIVEKGKVVWKGTSLELRANEELKQRYLGV